MAGDWIKMRVNLSTHPKVLAMAEFLHGHGRYVEWQDPASAIGGVCFSDQDRAEHEASVYRSLRVTRYVTVASLLRFWGYANEHADAEFIRGLRLADIDEITGVPGFGEAMQAVGWAAPDPTGGGVRLPNFSEFNSVAKARSKSAERQKRYRERHGDASGNAESNALRDVTVTPKRREEKKREEKEEKTGGLQPPADEYPAVFEQTWAAYPKRAGGNPKGTAYKCWQARTREGHDPAVILAGVTRYAEFCRATGKVRTETVMQAKRFFGPEKPFLEAWELPAAPAKTYVPTATVPRPSFRHKCIRCETPCDGIEFKGNKYCAVCYGELQAQNRGPELKALLAQRSAA